MNNIQLFIEGQEIELTSAVQFSLSLTYEDLNDPTAIINSYTKTVDIPFTERNNRIFGNIFEPNTMIAGGAEEGEPLIGIFFDPTRKLDMRLIWNGQPIMTGYAKLNTVTRSGKGFGSYNITLNGQLGKIFQELQKIVFDEAPEGLDPAYVIDTQPFMFDRVINKQLVYDSWNLPSLPPLDLADATDLTDILGFAPNNAFSDGFSYDMNFEPSLPADQKFRNLTDILNISSPFTALGIPADQVIGDGLPPRAFKEYRSYLQRPFIFFNKLWQIFQQKAESLTDYTWDLDPDWFSSDNTYWTRLVKMLSWHKEKTTAREAQLNDYQHITPSQTSSTSFTYEDPGIGGHLYRRQYVSAATRPFYATSEVTNEALEIYSESSGAGIWDLSFIGEARPVDINMHIDYSLALSL